MKIRLFSLFTTIAFLAAPIAFAQLQTNTKNGSYRAAASTTVVKTRPFYMGFSPWPYDVSLEAMRWTDSAIKQYGDIIEQHFEEGVPWPEAGANQPYRPGMEAEIKSRVERMGEYRALPSPEILYYLTAKGVGGIYK